MLWNVYMSDKNHTGQESMILTTPWLVWWLIFGDKKYIITISKKKEVSD